MTEKQVIPVIPTVHPQTQTEDYRGNVNPLGAAGPANADWLGMTHRDALLYSLGAVSYARRFSDCLLFDIKTL
jgi:hypothetical protein